MVIFESGRRKNSKKERFVSANRATPNPRSSRMAAKHRRRPSTYADSTEIHCSYIASASGAGMGTSASTAGRASGAEASPTSPFVSSFSSSPPSPFVSSFSSSPPSPFVSSAPSPSPSSSSFSTVAVPFSTASTSSAVVAATAASAFATVSSTASSASFARARTAFAAVPRRHRLFQRLGGLATRAATTASASPLDAIAAMTASAASFAAAFAAALGCPASFAASFARTNSAAIASDAFTANSAEAASAPAGASAVSAPSVASAPSIVHAVGRLRGDERLGLDLRLSKREKRLGGGAERLVRSPASAAACAFGAAAAAAFAASRVAPAARFASTIVRTAASTAANTSDASRAASPLFAEYQSWPTTASRACFVRRPRRQSFLHVRLLRRDEVAQALHQPRFVLGRRVVVQVVHRARLRIDAASQRAKRRGLRVGRRRKFERQHGVQNGDEVDVRASRPPDDGWAGRRLRRARESSPLGWRRDPSTSVPTRSPRRLKRRRSGSSRESPRVVAPRVAARADSASSPSSATADRAASTAAAYADEANFPAGFLAENAPKQRPAQLGNPIFGYSGERVGASSRPAPGRMTQQGSKVPPRETPRLKPRRTSRGTEDVSRPGEDAGGDPQVRDPAGSARVVLALRE